MSNKQFHINHPITGKKLVVSREVYSVIMKNNEKVQKIENGMKEVGKITAQKYYSGENRLVEVITKFNENSSISEFDLNLNLKGEFAELSQDQQELVQRAMRAFALCLNEAIGNRADDVKDKLNSKAA